MSLVPPTGSKLSPPSACTAARIRKVSRLVSHIFDQYLEPHGLTVTQFGVLGHIKADDGVDIGTLAERMVIDPTSLTRTIRPLERQGLIRLEPDPNDRRHRRLSLTEAGRLRHGEARAGWARGQGEIVERVGADEAAALNSMLDRTIERLAR